MLISSWASVTTDNGAKFPRLASAIAEMQDPAKVDKITQINRTLDETKEEVVRQSYFTLLAFANHDSRVCPLLQVRTIDSILERGAKLDTLVDQSEDLSRQSKMFYKQAKKTNSCCVIL